MLTLLLSLLAPMVTFPGLQTFNPRPSILMLTDTQDIAVVVALTVVVTSAAAVAVVKLAALVMASGAMGSTFQALPMLVLSVNFSESPTTLPSNKLVLTFPTTMISPLRLPVRMSLSPSTPSPTLLWMTT